MINFTDMRTHHVICRHRTAAAINSLKNTKIMKKKRLT